MSVKVISSTPRTRADSEHQDGAEIVVQDGHLIVLSDLGDMSKKTIAIYTPGSWVSAEVTK